MPADMRPRLLAIPLALALLTGAGLAVAQLTDDGRIGPDRRLLDNGRQLTPYGKLSPLGNFPTGGRVTPNGRFFWTVSTGRGAHDIRVISVRTGKVLQTLPLPGASGGIAMDPTRPLVYVSGVHGSSHKLQAPPAGAPGADGDVVHVFSYSPRFGVARFERVIKVPPPSSASTPQNFPPTNSKKIAWPDRLAVSPDGKRLLVPLNLADAAAIVDSESGAVRYVKTGAYPYGAAILPDGKTGLVSNETPGTVSVVDLDTGQKVKDIQVGAHLSHPEAIAVDPNAPRAYVTVTNSDQVAVIDTKELKVERTLSVERPEGLGAAPVDLAVTPDGGHLLVDDQGTDEIAVFHLPGGRLPGEARKAKAKKKKAHKKKKARKRKRHRAHRAIVASDGAKMTATREDDDWRIVGRIPTAQLPMAVDVTSATANPCGHRTAKPRGKRDPRCMKVLYVSSKGLGTGPNPDGPRPDRPEDSDDLINKTQYLPLLNDGQAGVGDFPTTRTLPGLTAMAGSQIVPTNHVAEPPPDTPLRPGGPIKHVFYIVRENRTYDQILGDLGRGDGDPKLAIFGAQVTPNAHALAGRFPLVDHVYANSEASIDGHFWTSAAKVSDYVHKAWFANYGGRGGPDGFGVYSVTVRAHRGPFRPGA